MGRIKVGKPDVKTDLPSHTKGVREGNEAGAYKKEVGHHKDGRSDARRSTGIHPKARNVIDPDMPNISPP